MNAAISMDELSSTDQTVASPRISVGQMAALVVSALLHIAVAAMLLGWQPEPPPSAAAISVAARLISLPSAPPAALPEPPPPLPASAPAPVVAEPAPAAQAELARRRIERDEQLRRQRLEQQRLETERLESERQQRERAEQRALAEAQAAQQARLDAERAAAQAAAAAEAASRRYEPIEKIAPGYPARAMERRIEGDCTVRYTVSSSGRVENPAVIGDCHPLFAIPSLTAAKRFRYQPRIVDGRAVAVPGVTNTFHYRIQPQN